MTRFMSLRRHVRVEPGKHTVFTTLELARRWVKHYNAWRDTGRWPQEEAFG